jgi:hypothetical protein
VQVQLLSRGKVIKTDINISYHIVK